jgi:hypothetical protein
VSDSQSAAGGAATPEPTDNGDVVDPIYVEMDKRVDLALALAFAVFGAGAFYYALDFRVGGFPDPVTARGLPYVTGAYLVVAGIVLAARRLITWSDIPGNYAVSEGAVDQRGHASSTLRPYAIMALILAWLVTVRSVGYLVVMPLMIFAMLWLMNLRSAGKLIVFPVLFTLLSWIAFSQILGITLPLGFLAPLARSWGLLM